MARTLCGSKPGSVECSAAKVRIIRAAPANSTSARATSETTSTERARLCNAASGAAALFERRNQVGVGGVERGEEAEENARGQRHRDGEHGHPPIEQGNGSECALGIGEPRDVAGRNGEQQAHAPGADGESQHRAHAGQQNALGEKLADHAPAAGADAPRGWPVPSAARPRAPAAGWRHWRRRSAARSQPRPAG